MAKCKKCEKSSLFLKINSDNICTDCQIRDLTNRNNDLLYELNQANQKNSSLRFQLDNSTQKNSDLQKALETLQESVSEEGLNELIMTYHQYRNKLAQIKSAYEAKNIWLYDDVDLNLNIFNDEYMEINYRSVNVPTLKKMFKQTISNIKGVYNEYFNAYSEEPKQQAVFKLVQLLIAAKFDIAMKSLKYGLISDITQNFSNDMKLIKEITTKIDSYLSNTITWCIGKVQTLYVDALNIEYTYYTEQQRIKEEQQAIKEQMRQEAAERKALEKERKALEKEESKYTAEIDNVKNMLINNPADEKLLQRIAQLEKMLADMQSKKEQILSLENGKAGYVYVISNIGSFGDNVYKIGMTRRLDPMDRVNELGNASVPFPFDVHCFIFSSDAVELEHKIHTILSQKRVNKVNLRKEFFYISIDELEKLVAELCPTAEFKRTALAEQYRYGISL